MKAGGEKQYTTYRWPSIPKPKTAWHSGLEKPKPAEILWDRD